MENIEILLDDFLEKEVVNPKKNKVKIGDNVVVSIDGNLYSGRVVNKGINMKTTSYIVRKFTNDDKNKLKKNHSEAKEALKYAKKLKENLNLEMSFIDCIYTFDRKQMYYIYVSENRIDFRTLAKKLADRYKTRIELRQIGVRDKAKKIGGVGPCGLFLCCNRFLTDFNSVSINMAKNQFLALNPTKINGICGRLLCCLNYENDTYKELRAKAPNLGSIIDTKKGKGKVIDLNLFKHTCVVEYKDKNKVTIDYLEENEKTR